MKRLALGLALGAIALLTVACSSSGATQAPASAGPASPGASAPAGGGTTIVAKNIAFEPTTVTVKAGSPTDIVLDNQDSAPHNIAIKDASGATVFKGEIISGPTQKTYNVAALTAGTYQFWCEVHPNMTGTLTAD
jgi:plastocyanin